MTPFVPAVLAPSVGKVDKHVSVLKYAPFVEEVMNTCMCSFYTLVIYSLLFRSMEFIRTYWDKTIDMLPMDHLY